MNRMSVTLVAATASAVLCLSSYEIAAANAPRPAAVSATQGLGACATAAGYLRLVDGSAHCPTGYAKVALAQSSTAARSTSLHLTSGSQSRTIMLPGGNSLKATCTIYSNSIDGRLDVVNKNTAVHVRGTFQSATQGGGSFYDFMNESTYADIPDNAPQLIDYSKTGTFVGDSSSTTGYYSAHAQLTVIASGATYTLTANWQETGSPSSYCGMDMTVQLTG